MKRTDNCRNLVGLIPAAGNASRLQPLPCSKEIFQTGFYVGQDNRSPRLKPVCSYLLEAMRKAAAFQVFIIIRDGKWDIPSYLGSGKAFGMHFAYLMTDVPFGVPFTLNQAFFFVKDALVVFGFPDIIFKPQNAFVKLLQKQNESKSDVILGLFSTHPNHKGDMVTLGQNGKLESIQVNPESVDGGHTWIIAAWTSKFTHFLNEYISARQNFGDENKTHSSHNNELFMGDAFQVALENDLSIEVVHFPEGSFLDIGSPANLAKIIRTDIELL